LIFFKLIVTFFFLCRSKSGGEETFAISSGIIPYINVFVTVYVNSNIILRTGHVSTYQKEYHINYIIYCILMQQVQGHKNLATDEVDRQ